MTFVLGTANAQAKGRRPTSKARQTVVTQSKVHPTLTVFEQEEAMTPVERIKRWQPFVTTASRRVGVPVVWINAVMRVESGGRTMLSEKLPMVSPKGAMGLMQVLPKTYEDMRAQYKLGPNAFDPKNNIHAGAAYLRWLRGRYGYPAMFAAYNAGPERVDDLLARGTPLPAETQAYVSRVGDILDKSGGLDGTSINMAKLTRPDGSPVLVDPMTVSSVRAVLPGEYPAGVNAVLSMGRLTQGVREDSSVAKAAIRVRGGRV